jgi:hypothetical protein
MPIIDFPPADVRPRGRTKRRLLQLPIAATAILGTVALTAAPASATQTCTGKPDSNLCFSINQRADGNFDVHVGIDVHMPLDEAQEYVNNVGEPPFTVWIHAYDGKPGRKLFSVPMTEGTLDATPDFGLSAEFDRIVDGRDLDANPRGTDVVLADVTLTDTDTNTKDPRGPFISNRLTGNWPF